MKPPTSFLARGISLWELLWVLGIAGTLATWAIPSFRGFLLDARRTADINAFVLAVQLSRSETAKTGLPVVLCKTVDRSACANSESRFDSGWMVFQNVDENRPPSRAAACRMVLGQLPGGQPATDGS